MDYHIIFLTPLWISPLIKSITNELDIIFRMIMSQLSGHCDIISNQLWRHQQNENMWEWDTGKMWKDRHFVIIYGFVMSCKK